MRSSTRTRPYKLLHNIQLAGCSPVKSVCMRPASATVQLVQERTVVVGCSPAQARVVHREGAALCVRRTDARMRAAAERGEKCGDWL